MHAQHQYQDDIGYFPLQKAEIDLTKSENLEHVLTKLGTALYIGKDTTI